MYHLHKPVWEAICTLEFLGGHWHAKVFWSINNIIFWFDLKRCASHRSHFKLQELCEVLRPSSCFACVEDEDGVFLRLIEQILRKSWRKLCIRKLCILQPMMCSVDFSSKGESQNRGASWKALGQEGEPYCQTVGSQFLVDFWGRNHRNHLLCVCIYTVYIM